MGKQMKGRKERGRENTKLSSLHQCRTISAIAMQLLTAPSTQRLSQLRQIIAMMPTAAKALKLHLASKLFLFLTLQHKLRSFCQLAHGAASVVAAEMIATAFNERIKLSHSRSTDTIVVALAMHIRDSDAMASTTADAA